MNDIVKLREMLSKGYHIRNVDVDVSGKAIVTLNFSGMGEPVEGQIYYLITDDKNVIEKAKELRRR